MLGSFAAFAAVGALMGTPTSAPLAAETARQAVVPVSVPPSMAASLEARARDAAVDRLLARGRPGAPVEAAVRDAARAQLRGVPMHVLQLLDKSEVRIVVLREGESLLDVGAMRTVDVARDYGDGTALRATAERVRSAVDAAYVPRIKALEHKLATMSPSDARRDDVVSDLEIARSDRNEALYKGVYDASGGRLDQQDGMATGADRLGIDGAGPLSPIDVARIHGARTPQEIDSFVRLLRAVNGDERLEAAQRHYAAEPDAATHAGGDVTNRPMRLWREGIVVPAYEHVRSSRGTSAVVSSTDATSLLQWRAGDIEGQYFYEGNVNTLVVHERNLGAHAAPNRVLLHELGHAYEDAVSEQAPARFDEWRTRRDGEFARLRDTDGRFPSEYASRSASELSAETFADRFDGHPRKGGDAAWRQIYDDFLKSAPRVTAEPSR